MTEWTLLETFPILRRQAPANRCGWYLADLVGRFLHQPEPHPKTWDAMITALRELDAGCSTDRVILAFHWRLLCDLGYRPRLDLTGFSGETVAFSAESGGVVADTGAADRWRVRRPTIELLIEVGEGDGMIPDGADPDTTARANRLLATWIRELLGTESVPMRLLFGS